MSINLIEQSYDIVVVGGGLSGMCAAIAAARHGAKTAIINNRSVYGGNASSEIRMHIVGASSHAAKADLAETGILMEMLLENKRRNPYACFPVFDSILWETVHFQENLTSYLNTNMDDMVMEGGRIRTVICHQNTTETELRLSARIFVDATGHGTLGVMAGCGSRLGTEARSEFGEPDAPDMANTDTMGNTLMFSAVDRGEKVVFEKPKWAYTFTEEQLKYREHANSVGSHADGGALVEFEEGSGRLPHFSNVDNGYWWIELGGDWDDIIRQGEEIRDELVKCVYGVWDHLKNQGDHGVDNYDLDWVGMVPGYRESRRLEGDYLLNENDVRANRIFDDAVAYGGWQMDQHTVRGLFDFDKVPSRILNFDGCYTIPYRCFYSRKVPNLMMAGRDISTTKTAFGSTRVMGTCAVGGQAVGTAAAMAVRYDCDPRQLGQTHMDELQQTLLKDDCYIPGYQNCKLVSSAATTGIRESRRILGEYQITGEECAAGARFADVIVHKADFLVDIHNPSGSGQADRTIQRCKPYDLPYGCFVPRKIDGLYVAGRCISGTHRAYASYRVMSICMAMGQAVGVAAALCVRQGCLPRALDISGLQKALTSLGIDLFSE